MEQKIFRATPEEIVALAQLADEALAQGMTVVQYEEFINSQRAQPQDIFQPKTPQGLTTEDPRVFGGSGF